MKLYLVRHGQTDMNVEHRLQGTTDTPLNERGKQQARNLHKKLAQENMTFDVVYCSPLQRARLTGHLATGIDEKNFILEPRIAEMNMGDLERHTYEELGPGFMASFFEDPSTFVPIGGGETFPQLIQRTAGFLEELKKDPPGERVLAVSHGAAIRAMLAYVESTPLKSFWNPVVDNCQLIALELMDGLWSVAAE